MDQPDDRLPLPSEDGGDLVEEPPTGMSDDPLVATEEGVPYTPPTDRVVALGPEGPDFAGVGENDAEELERADTVQVPTARPPTDGELAADVVETLRASDVVAGDRIRVAAEGRRVILSGQVETVDVLEEILGIAGDVPGVDEVIDEVEVIRA